jgi:regulator of sigma E protease
VNSVESESAKASGIVEGDRIVAINGTATPYFRADSELLSEARGTTATVDVVRGVDTLALAVPISDEGLMGITVRQTLPRHNDYGFWASIPAGAKRGVEEIKSYWEQVKLIFNPETKLYKEVGGFIAIGNIFPGEWNWMAFWNLTALLSIMLAVMNLLPIPGLDGGHALFTLWEIITRRKPSDKFLEVMQYIGLFLLLALLIYANGSDIVRLFK